MVGFDIKGGREFSDCNGAGKTSLISILAGLSVHRQEVLVHGHDVVADYAIARRLLEWCRKSWCLIRFSPCPRGTAYSVGLFRHQGDAWIDELLDSLGLADKTNANMRQLSETLKRRVLLVAQALVHKPRSLAGRAHRGCGCRAASNPLAVHCQTQQTGQYCPADHPLPGG
jgi:ABC-2 type transport system ATP-binding protein